MLFILIMDVLHSLIMKAEDQGLLYAILRGGGGQRLSLYADDVVLFLRPRVEELTLVKELLRVFGVASDVETMSWTWCRRRFHAASLSFPACTLACPFPCLGCPKRPFLHLLDRIANYLPRWKSALMHPAGRV